MDKRNNLVANGNARAAGGRYGDVRMVGEGWIDGDLECVRLRCVGNSRIEGNAEAGVARVVGTCRVSGHVRGGRWRVLGQFDGRKGWGRFGRTNGATSP